MNDPTETDKDDNRPKGFKNLSRVLFALGTLLSFIGLYRQWPVVGKSYPEFVDGEGYLTLIMGLLIFVLGFSVPLLIDDD